MPSREDKKAARANAKIVRIINKQGLRSFAELVDYVATNHNALLVYVHQGAEFYKEYFQSLNYFNEIWRDLNEEDKKAVNMALEQLDD